MAFRQERWGGNRKKKNEICPKIIAEIDVFNLKFLEFIPHWFFVFR